MASEKRCLYEILGLSRDCSPEEIRSAYRKLALQRHPDKLIKTGIPEEQATAAFQELVNAYEVLSDPRERTWYDSHRSQILFSDPKSSGSSSVPELFSFFSNSVFSGFGDTGKGFYKVYGDLFGKIYAQELSFATKLGLGAETVRDAPLMGNFESPYAQVSAFYNYWLGFCTVLDFCWVDEYDAMAGPNRKSRRLMEEENKKLRKRARKEYNETVRGLAEFVKKRDKRVIEMQMKKNLEQEKRREEEKARKKELERVKLEKARLYEEPEWAKIDGEEIENGFDEDGDDNNKNSSKELYCVVCSKKFKSDKQWKNHEQSKKHREKVAELRDSFDTEVEEEEKEEEVLDIDMDESHADLGPSILEGVVDELQEQSEGGFGIKEERSEVKYPSSEEGIEVSDVNNGDESTASFGSDDEINILKAMLSGKKGRKNAASRYQSELSSCKSNVGPDAEEVNFMEYDNRKSTRRRRAGKREGAKKSNGEAVRAERGEVTEEEISISNGNDARGEEDNVQDISRVQNALFHTVKDARPNDRRDPLLDTSSKVLHQPNGRESSGKGDTNTKSRNASKGKKNKASSKSTGLLCETCGENFESRNKLHKHLGDTGHATLKSR